MFSTIAGCLLGVLLGMRHAMEPDHLAAVSALTAERRGFRPAAAIGAFWGAGHAAALTCVAGPLIAFQLQMPKGVALWLELSVAAAVVLLGLRALWKAHQLGRSGPSFAHAHGRHRHCHPGPPAHVHLSSSTFATRPLVVGLIHGMAGSGALAALVVSQLDGLWTRLLYLGLFGFGSTLGMAALTGMAGFSMARLTSRRAEAGLLVGSGLLAVGTGAWWAAHSASGLLWM